MTVDSATFLVWLAGPVALLPWELWLLWRRWKRQPGEPRVRTISQVARDYGPRLTGAVFFWSSMPVHWWAPIPWEGTATTGVGFWLVQAGLLAWNLIAWRRTARPVGEWPAWLRWLNWPTWYLVAGPVAAAVLFPQNGWVP